MLPVSTTQKLSVLVVPDVSVNQTFQQDGCGFQTVPVHVSVLL